MPSPHAPRRGMSLKKRLLVASLALALLPLTAATGVAYTLARASLLREAIHRIESVRDMRARDLSRLVRESLQDVATIADAPEVGNALEAFATGLAALPASRGWDRADEAAAADRKAVERSLRTHYADVFSAEWARRGGKPGDVETLFPTSDAALLVQHLWIAENPRPPGSKHLLERRDGDATDWGTAHAKHHGWFSRLMTTFGWYDALLVHRDGATVVYTAGKEVDLGADLERGPLRSTGLASAYRRAVALGPGTDGVVEDFAAYPPSYGEPAAFLAAPVRRDGRVLGVLVVQLGHDAINRIARDTTGLGESGESYFAGPDSLMRSNSRYDAGRQLLVRKVSSDAVRDALAGRSGSGTFPDWRRVDSVGAWGPVPEFPLGWVLVAKEDEAEVTGPARDLLLWMIGLSLAIAAVAVVAALRISARAAAPVAAAAEQLQGLATTFHGESQEQQAGAAEQSAAVEETRQTFAGLLDASRDLSKVGTDVLSHAEVSQRSAQAIHQRIEELSTHSRHIGEILALVRDIANKSEILALNAALEGTKAGEAGRGFSLVATQMQRLAEQVMGSVSKIEGLTGDIQRSSQGAVLAAEEAQKVAALTTESARRIARSVSTQQAGTEQVSVAMNEIAQVAGRNADAARKMVGSANDLISLAQDLRRTVGTRG